MRSKNKESELSLREGNFYPTYSFFLFKLNKTTSFVGWFCSRESSDRNKGCKSVNFTDIELESLLLYTMFCSMSPYIQVLFKIRLYPRICFMCCKSNMNIIIPIIFRLFISCFKVFQIHGAYSFLNWK